jgi:hypothetical protein
MFHSISYFYISVHACMDIFKIPAKERYAYSRGCFIAYLTNLYQLSDEKLSKIYMTV